MASEPSVLRAARSGLAYVVRSLQSQINSVQDDASKASLNEEMTIAKALKPQAVAAEFCSNQSAFKEVKGDATQRVMALVRQSNAVVAAFAALNGDKPATSKQNPTSKTPTSAKDTKKPANAPNAAVKAAPKPQQQKAMAKKQEIAVEEEAKEEKAAPKPQQKKAVPKKQVVPVEKEEEEEEAEVAAESEEEEQEAEGAFEGLSDDEVEKASQSGSDVEMDKEDDGDDYTNIELEGEVEEEELGGDESGWNSEDFDDLDENQSKRLAELLAKPSAGKSKAKGQEEQDESEEEWDDVDDDDSDAISLNSLDSDDAAELGLIDALPEEMKEEIVAKKSTKAKKTAKSEPDHNLDFSSSAAAADDEEEAELKLYAGVPTQKALETQQREIIRLRRQLRVMSGRLTNVIKMLEREGQTLRREVDEKVEKCMKKITKLESGTVVRPQHQRREGGSSSYPRRDFNNPPSSSSFHPARPSFDGPRPRPQSDFFSQPEKRSRPQESDDQNKKPRITGSQFVSSLSGEPAEPSFRPAAPLPQPAPHVEQPRRAPAYSAPPPAAPFAAASAAPSAPSQSFDSSSRYSAPRRPFETPAASAAPRSFPPPSAAAPSAEELHPSWAAKKRQTEMAKNGPKATKISFD